MIEVHYTHADNSHSLESAVRALGYLLEGRRITSLLDVGAGTGTWLRAAQKADVSDLMGVDGVPVGGRQIWVDPALILHRDLRAPLALGRVFDAVLCLEVAEHLPDISAHVLIESLTTHADLIFFSAAPPGQLGEGHINCQWPAYWQTLFNKHGFSCSDELRPSMWNDPTIEPWYRQNLFVAHKSSNAGTEPRILPVLHPDMVRHMVLPDSPEASRLRMLEQGRASASSYARIFRSALARRMGLA